jgi:GH24 family phage-related lysozyme (muramidase)
MNSYLYKILNENEDVEYTQEQYNKSQRDLRKTKLILKHIRPNKSLCSFFIVAFPTYNEVKIFPIFTELYTPHNEFQRIKKKIDSVLPNNIKVWEWMGGGVDCDEWKELTKKFTPETKSTFSEFIFPEHKDEELTEKWSEKYKKSIDCNNPKGFSQKAHCQGKKKKDLDEYSRSLRMTRRQGVGTNFPKSAIAANPSRFRPYSRGMNEGSMKYLDKVVELCRLLNEEKKPDAEWEFEVKKNVDKSLDWVKTKDQAISYIKTLFDKIKNVSDNIKHKILRYVIYSFVGLFTITQMNNIYDGLTKEKPNVEKIETIGSGDKKKEEVKKQPEKKETTQIRNYDDRLVSHIKNEEGSIENKGEPVLVAYDIGDGAKTIGYGHAVFNSESRGNTGGDYSFLPKYNKIIVGKTKITKKQAETILRDDLDKTKIQLNHILDGWGKEGIRPDIDQNMYNAMISMMYNMGVGNFKKTQFIQYVKKNQMDKAKDQIKKESSRSFRRFPGVKDRREKESKMFGGEEINESIGNELKFGKNYASNFLFRRITKEELDETFKHYYEYFYDFWYSLNFRNETFDTFKRRFIDYMMDNIHGELVDGYEGEMGQKLGNGIEEILDEMYGERIEFLWDILTNEEV